MNIVNKSKPAATIIPRYLTGYPPKNMSTSTIEKMIAVVEKLAGKINNNTSPTGTQSGKIDSLKVRLSLVFLERYRAT